MRDQAVRWVRSRSGGGGTDTGPVPAPDLVAAVRTAYVDLDDPQLHFVGTAADRRPFELLVAELTEEHGFAVEPTTDLDYDVCFGYVVARDAVCWALELSLVGPFAALARLPRNAWTAVLTDRSRDLTGAEALLVSAVSRAGLRLLPVEELEAPIGLGLPDVDPEDVRVYQAVFSHTDRLPWDDSFPDGR